MSRGRTRHQGSRRRAYSVRQREVRERRLRTAREEETWSYDGSAAVEQDPASDEPSAAWTLHLQGRPAAA